MRILNDLSRGRVETLTLLDAISANINNSGTGIDVLWPLISGTFAQNTVLPAYNRARSLTVTGGTPDVERIGGLAARVELGHGNIILAGEDSTDYEHGNATVDSAFSVGLWVNQDAAATADLISKYDAAGLDREWRLQLDNVGDINFEIFDESATASEIANAATVYTAGQWRFIVATYDGDQTTPVVNIYVDGIAKTAGATTEAGTYVAMEAGATPLLIGASGTTAAPVNIFKGKIALPFTCDVELTGKQVTDIYHNSGILLGMFEATP